MPRRTPVRELQAEENSDGSLRRSSRIAQNSPDPARIIQRRNSGNINETPAKITRAKRLSLSQESNLEPADSKSSSEGNQAGLAKRTRLTRSASKSPTALAKEVETKSAGIKTRGRRGSLSKSEDIIDSPAVTTRSRSTRSESISPTSLKDVEAAKPRARRGSISDKISPLEKIEEVEQSITDSKRRYRGRHSSVPEMSQLDIIRENETEKKGMRQNTESISENVEDDENEKAPTLDAEKTGELPEDRKENKIKLSPVVRIEKSRVIASLTTSSKSENPPADKTLETDTIDKIGNDNDNIKKNELHFTKEATVVLDSDKTVAFPEQESNSKVTTGDNKSFKKNGLEEKQVLSIATETKADSSLLDNEIGQKSNNDNVHETPDDTQKEIASKLAVEDKIIVENIDKVLNTDKSINEHLVVNSDTKTNPKEPTEIANEKIEDESEYLVEIDVVGDEPPHETDAVLSKTFENTEKNNIAQKISGTSENESKTVLSDDNDTANENPKDKSLSNLLPNQLNVSVGSDGSFRMDLSLRDTETGSSQEDLFPANKQTIVTDENTLNTSGNSDKENTKSTEQLKESTPKPKTSNEKKVPLTNVSFNEMNENPKPTKGSSHDSFCEPMEVDDPPLTYREITSTNKRQSLNNKEKSLTPTKKSRKSTDNIPAEEPQNSVLQYVTTIEVIEKDKNVENKSKTDISETKCDKVDMNNETEKHTLETLIILKEESIKIDGNAVEVEVSKTRKQVEDVGSPQDPKKVSNKSAQETSELDEEDCASPVFSISNTDVSDEEENSSPNTQNIVKELSESKKVELSEISADSEAVASQNISKELDSKGDRKNDENVIASDDKVPQTEHESPKCLTTPESLEKKLQSNSSITPKKDTLEFEKLKHSANEENITSCIRNVSPDIAAVSKEDVPISGKNSNKFVSSDEDSAKVIGKDAETDEPVASTSKAKSNVTLTNSPSPKKIKIVSNVVINEKELLSISDINKKEKSLEKDSIIEICKNQEIIPDIEKTQRSDVTTTHEIDVLVLTETVESRHKVIKEHQSDGISSESSKNIDTNMQNMAAAQDVNSSRIPKRLKPTNIQGHAEIETKATSSPNKGSTLKNVCESDTKSKSLKKKSSKTSKYKDVTDDLEEKVEKLIEDALNEVPSSSSEDEEMEREEKETDEDEEAPEDVNEYIDDMAEEVEDEEETPSEDSNEIVCEGESINSSDTYTEGDDDSDVNDSFIDDGEEQELLSGEEDFLQKLTPKKEKTKLVSPSKFSKKHKRIITPSESEDENQVPNVESFPDNDQSHIVDVEIVEDEVQAKVSDSKTTEVENESTAIKEDIQKPEEIAKVAVETQANIPIDLIPSKNDIIYVDNDSDSVSSVKEESTSQKDMNISFDKKSKRKSSSSITIQENIKLEDVQDGELSERISKVVDWFYSGIKGKKCDTGNISFNVSLDYDDQSSVEENVSKEANVNTKEDTASSNLKNDNVYIESKLPEKAAMEEDDSADIFVRTLSKTDKPVSPKKLKKLKRESLQRQSDDEEIPTLIEVSKVSSTLRETSKQSPKTGIKLAKSRTSGTKRLSGESIQHLSPKRGKLETDFVVEDVVFNKGEKKKSKKVKGYIVKEMEENLEISTKKIKKKDKTEINKFKPVEVHKKIKKIKTKKDSSDDENASSFSDDVFITKNKSSAKKKRANVDSEFDVEIDHTNSNKKKKYIHATNETDNIPCSSGILKLHVSTDTNVSKREVERSTDKTKKLKRNVSQKLLPTRKIDLNNSWESEIFDVSLHPSVSNKKMSDVAASKKKKTEGPFSSKDFKNRMLYDSSRIKRIDTKILLRQRRNI